MSEAFLIALIGLGGAIGGGILTAIIPIIWQRSKGQTNISAKISHYRFVIPKFLDEAIKSHLDDYSSDKRPTSEAREKFRHFQGSLGYSEVEITNNSRKLAKGIAVHLGNDAQFAADVTIDGETRATNFSRVCEIGDLKSNSTCKVRIWTSWAYTEDSWSYYSYYGAVKVTANEYDKIVLHFPKPAHLKKYVLVRQGLLWGLFWLVLIAYNFFGWLYFYRK